METQWYASVAGIVGGTLIIVEVLKRAIGNVSVLKSVPTWVYSVAVAVGLTYTSRALGLLAEQGSTLDVLMSALMLAASASGFWTWLRQPADQIKNSEPAERARGYFPAVLLAVALAGAASACASRNIGPELVAAQDGIHDAMKSAFEGVERICAPGLLPDTCRAANGAMASALRAGRSFSVAVHSERLEGLGTFVAEVGRAIGDIQKLPAGDLRERVLADLRLAINEAFKGAQ